MIKSLIRFSVHNSVVVIFVTAIVSLYGIYAFKNLSVDAVPDITNTQVQVITLATGLVPEEVERQVTFPIETSLNGIKGVEDIRSVSRFGLSHITVIFSEGSKILEARQLISERLKLIERDLAGDYKVFMGPIVTGLGDIFHYTVVPTKKKLSELSMEETMELRSVQDWIVRPRLLRVKGVAEVNTTGGYSKQYYVLPDLQKMLFNGISFHEIMNALKINNFNVGGSYFEKGDSQILIQGSGLLKSIPDIENVPIKMSKNLSPIFIKDVAEVKLDRPLIVGSATYNGESAIIGSPLMMAGENSREVSVRLKKSIEDLNKNVLKDYEVRILYDRSDLVKKTLATVNGNLYFGCGLVVLVLLLLIGNFRAAMITSIMIPISLLITFIIMKLTNLSGNLMSLGALDFGVIIDGVVIVIDNCIRQMQNRATAKGSDLSKEEIKETIIDATSEIMSAASLGRIIIILVFIPLLLLGGVEGKMFAPMAKTFIYALVAVFVLSFTSVPALASHLLKNSQSHSKPFVLRMFEKFYFPSLQWSLSRFGVLTGLSVGLLLVSMLAFTRMGGEFIPKMDEGSAAIRVVRKADIAPSYVISEQKRLEKLIMEIPEVGWVFTRIGTAEVPDDPNGMNSSDMVVEFKPEKEWRENIKRVDIREEILKKLKADPRGAIFMMGQPIEMRSNELLEGTRADISLKVFGDDLDLNVTTAEKIQAEISKVRGASDVELDVQGKNSLLKITANEQIREQLAFGRGHILETVQMALGGQEVGRIYEDMRSFPLMIRLKHSDREDIKKIESLPISIREGLNLQLKEISHVEILQAHSVITRENLKRRVAIQINVKDRDMESFVVEAAARVERKVKLPEGMRIVWGGNFKNLQNAKERLSFILPITLLIVFLLIYYAFFNWSLSLLIFACIPFAWVGGILMLLAGGLPFSISAGVGFIALAGIAVINGMILVAYFNTLKSQGMTGDDLILSGVSLRLRPVLMTAMTDIFGFLPMAFASGLGAEVQKPLALVVIGGVISATLLTLIFIPVLYKRFEKSIGLAKLVDH